MAAKGHRSPEADKAKAAAEAEDQVLDLIQEINPSLLHKQKVSKGELVGVVKSAVRISTTRVVSSPFPPAEELAAYEKVFDGGAREVFELVKGQSTHRRELETKAIDHQIDNSVKGRWCAVGLTVLVFGIGIYAIWARETVVACTIFGGTVGSLATVFYLGKRAERSDVAKTKDK